MLAQPALPLQSHIFVLGWGIATAVQNTYLLELALNTYYSILLRIETLDFLIKNQLLPVNF